MSGCLRPVLLVRLLAELRKKCGLEHTDMVVVYFESLDEDKSVSDRVLHSQEQYINVISMEYQACHVISVWSDLSSVQQETQTWERDQEIRVVLVFDFLVIAKLNIVILCS